MRITVDTAHDSHEDIRKVIKMLQHLVGDSQEIFTNQPEVPQSSPIANIFGDNAQPTQIIESETTQTTQQTTEQAESTEDLFAELFSEEELKKMDIKKEKEEESEIKPSKGKKYDIEFY